MSYHDHNPYRQTGIAVVNPLHEIQRKLDKIIQLVNDLDTEENEDAGVISIEHFRTIQDILDGTEDKDVK